MNILVLPNEKYPPNRPMLSVLWNQEISHFGNSLFWIMQSKNPCLKVSKRTWKNSTIYITPTLPNSNLLFKCLDNLMAPFITFVLSFIIIKLEKIVHIHAHDGAYQGLIALILSRLVHTKTSYAYTSHFIKANQSFLNQLKYLEKYLKKLQFSLQERIYKLILQKSDIVFPISSHLKTLLHQSLDLPYDKMIAVPEAASGFFLNYVSNQTQPFNNNPKKIVYAGSLGRKRNIEFIIDMFRLVVNQYDNVELLLLGWGERKNDVSLLKEYVKLKSLSDKVHFLGKVPYYQIPEILSKADIGLSPIPPLEEYLISTPTKCIECLSLKVPVVANYEIHDQKDVLLSSKGGILTKYDHADFAKSILTLLHSAKLRQECAISGYQWIKENRTFSKLAEAINYELRLLVNY